MGDRRFRRIKDVLLVAGNILNIFAEAFLLPFRLFLPRRDIYVSIHGPRHHQIPGRIHRNRNLRGWNSDRSTVNCCPCPVRFLSAHRVK